MKAIVHIGTEKTGTTTIQNFLYQNRRKLKSAGYYFMQSPGKHNHQAIPAICLSDDKYDDFFRIKGIETLEERKAYKAQFTAEFEAELKGLGPSIHTVILSSEHFHSRIRTEGEMDNVHRFLSPYFDDIRIICYLREQAVTASSYYSTSLKSGGDVSFLDFMRRCGPSNYYFNYYEMLGNWERAFGLKALDVSLFGKEHFHKGDLLQDFIAKIDKKLVRSLNTKVQSENESINMAGQVLIRAVNMVYPARTSRPEVAPLREKCRKLVYDKLKGKGQQLTLARRQEVYEKFADSNEKVRKKFFKRKRSLFPPPKKMAEPELEVDESFLEVQMGILNILRKDGRGIVTPEELARFNVALGESISQTIAESTTEAEEDDDARTVILTRDDADFLRRASRGYEKRNLQMSSRLLRLALAVDPSMPGARTTFERLQRKKKLPPQPRFMLRSFVWQDVNAKDESLVDGETMHGWYKSFQHQIVGAMVNELDNLERLGCGGGAPEKQVVSHHTYTIIEAASEEEALEIASRCPLLDLGGTIEVSSLGVLSHGA